MKIIIISFCLIIIAFLFIRTEYFNLIATSRYSALNDLYNSMNKGANVIPDKAEYKEIKIRDSIWDLWIRTTLQKSRQSDEGN